MINQQISVNQHHIVEDVGENVGDVGESLAKFDEEGVKKGKIIETSTKNNSSTDTNTNTKTSSNTDIILLSCCARNLRVLWKI